MMTTEKFVEKPKCQSMVMSPVIQSVLDKNVQNMKNGKSVILLDSNLQYFVHVLTVGISRN